MKNRSYLGGLIVLIIICFLLLLLRHHSENGVPYNDTNADFTASDNATNKTLKPRDSSETLKEAPLPQPTGVEASINNVYREWIKQNKVPIDFYGRVVDESTNPVPSADITFHWEEGMMGHGSKASTLQSDSDGLFSFHADHASALDITIRKKGYLSPRLASQSFGYVGEGHFVPDKARPILFVLRKKGDGTALITSENGIRSELALIVPKDGRPIDVDFVQKKITSTGELKIGQVKPPWETATNWSVTMSLSDGGFIETEEEFPFEAPVTGYQANVNLYFAKSDTNWITHINKSYYIMFGQPPKYGRIHVETDLSQMTVFLGYAINPFGSRNLESNQ